VCIDLRYREKRERERLEIYIGDINPGDGELVSGLLLHK
jgi:hypothetical protein